MSEDNVKKPLSIAEVVNRQVIAMMDEDGPQMLILDFEHLGWHVRRTPAELYYLGQQSAKLTRLEYDLKRAVRKAEADAYNRAYTRGCVELGKAPTQTWCENQVQLDEEVEKAHTEYARCIEQKKAVEVLYEALNKKASMIPALQGKANALSRGD